MKDAQNAEVPSLSAPPAPWEVGPLHPPIVCKWSSPWCNGNINDCATPFTSHRLSILIFDCHGHVIQGLLYPSNNDARYYSLTIAKNTPFLINVLLRSTLSSGALFFVRHKIRDELHQV
jgi:hypothetical protein